VSATDPNATPLPWRYRLAPWLAFVALMLLYHFLYGNFFPNDRGGLGHDYSGVLPGLLAGRYWYEANGLLSIPWYTPALCGGVPFLADPTSFYYSVPQWLAFVLDPLTAAYASVLLFAAIGYWGMFLLARRRFACGLASATTGAALFMFNGFFAYRMVIGHLIFHGIMLIPWVAYSVLADADGGSRRPKLADICNGVVAGLCGAYWIHSGMSSLVIPAALAVVLIACLHGVYRPGTISIWAGIMRIGVAIAVMTGISAFKLVGTVAYLGAFPRTGYLLPGLSSLWYAVVFAFKALFLSPPDIAIEVSQRLVNVQWVLDRHELEFGIGIAALALLLLGPWILRLHRLDMSAARRTRVAFAIVALLILALPIALNTYSPAWNAFLKRLPVIGASSNLFRWFVIYIPFLIMLGTLVIELAPVRSRTAIALIALSLLAATNVTADRRSYAAESYRPEPILAAYEGLAHGAPVPPVEAIRLRLTGMGRDGGERGSQYPNDQFIYGRSALACYDAIFGYRLENFPVRTLHEGSVNEEFDGRLNLKNPACYVYPSENGCSPGDHFRVDQREDMLRFASYRPYAFKTSELQRVANWTSAVTLFAALLILATGVWNGRRNLASRSAAIEAGGS